VLLAALAVPGFAVAAWIRDCAAKTNCGSPEFGAIAPVAVLVMAATAVACFLTLVAARRIADRHWNGPWAWPGAFGLGCCLAIGLAAATPVRAGWHDGCNGHGGRVALVEAPRVWLGSPENVYAAYTDIQTAMACIDVEIPELRESRRGDRPSTASRSRWNPTPRHPRRRPRND
jgi:hypothetical protein